LGICALVPAVPLLAHHPFAAEYDGNKKITISGVVTKVEWIPVLLKQGWKGDSLKAGARAKDASNTANASRVTLRDGHRVFGGSSATRAPRSK
jgi:hypothetical protein